MLTRSKQRLLENNENININNENRLTSLKRKRSTKTKAKVDKENVIPTNIRYSLRSQNKLKDNGLVLKSKNDNIINKRGVLKEKLLKNNIVNNVMKQSLKTNLLKENVATNKSINNKPLKAKKTDKVINKIQKEDDKENDTTTSIEPKAKKIKTVEKDNKNKESKDIPKTKLEKGICNEKKDQKPSIMKSSLSKKKDNSIPKEKKKITFDDNVQHIENSLNYNDTFSIDSDYLDNIRIDETNSKVLKIDESLSPIKKVNNELIVPFIRLDSDTSSITSTSSNSNIESENNKMERKSSGLSDKSLELLTDFTKSGGKVQLSELLESLSGKRHIKSSSPNNFNKTLRFLEESPINYTRILNEEMNFNTPQNGSVNFADKEVSNLSSQNTSFQVSNSLSNFINISPISNSDLPPTDSDYEHLHSGEIIDESDIFNTDDKSSLYTMDELDEKIKKLLTDKNNDNLKRLETSNYHYPPRSSTPSYSRLGMEAPVVEEITYDQPENISYLIQDQDASSSDDPFGFSKAEKIYKTKQQQLKTNGPHTPVSSHKQYNTQKRESHSLDNVNEILLQEHQQIIEAKKKNRNRKKLNIEEMEQLNSDDLEEIKKAKDQQMKYFKEIDDYVLNETVL
ncbi:hypothetical protein H8356DRAFT_1277489 [Neocallimastix lanati (nom. inval.)]|uniref:Uncharacterized protein n=1 Tax=Neocallimastix californiae TaxID=1754190 RepID=A0A1Y1Z734_9FUNG|nr:hypothetical protein H8356DRAFT_1277489 [Neocallimastix sp. JGI-2020a]ORY06059.1 hypothetical protein LY90DRAFT_519267 [Neocallimastix californiae]|eukprot:ORY06059.1 hypothetical protein LY90DRAFT_519267 [Neocallimastix californiae]